MAFTALLICVFVLLRQAEGDVREKTLYVETGTDLRLDVKNPVPLKENYDMFWNFKIKVNIVKLTQTSQIVHFGNYKGRADCFPQNQSLLLKNVQKTDSGEYRAEVRGDDDIVLIKYQVTVLDPVSDVKLEVKQCSSDWSDITVTCTTLDGLLSSTFICDETTCSHEEGEPVQNVPSGALMKVSLKNGAITCHHSNQVSSKEDTNMVVHLCWIKKYKDPVESALKDNASKTDNISITALFFILIILLALCVAAVYYRQRRKKRETDGGKKTDSTELQALQGDTGQVPGPRNDAQAETERKIRRLIEDLKDLLQDSGYLQPTLDPAETERKIRRMVEKLKDPLLDVLLKDFQQNLGPRNDAQAETESKIRRMIYDLNSLLQDVLLKEFQQDLVPRNDAQGHRRRDLWCAKTGTDLLLDVGELATLKRDDEICWKFQRKVNIVKFHCENKTVLHRDYKGRAEFSPQKQSLLLKNVQKTDSGEYSAGVLGSTNKDVVKYQVIVLDEKQGEEDPGHVDLEDSEEDPLQGLGPRNEAQGDVREETLYVKTGTDLPLDVKDPVTLKGNDEMCWKFQREVNILQFTLENERVPQPDYAGRAELFPHNQSLLLKNVQKTDSGEYRVLFSGDTNRVLAQFQVTVLDPVSGVKHKVKVQPR